MYIDHIHLSVRDLSELKAWLENCFHLHPISELRTDRLVYEFGKQTEFAIVFEERDIESRFTLGLQVDHPSRCLTLRSLPVL